MKNLKNFRFALNPWVFITLSLQACAPTQTPLPSIDLKAPPGAVRAHSKGSDAIPPPVPGSESSGSTSGSGTESGGSTSNSPLSIKSAFNPGELADTCKARMAQTETELASLATAPDSLIALETSLADLSDAITPLTFMSYVSTDAKISAEASDCSAAYSKFVAKINSRKDIYAALGALKVTAPDEQRLLAKTLEQYRKNGLDRPAADQVKIAALRDKLIQLQEDFKTNLNQDTSSISFTANELTGTPQSFLDRLPKTPDGLKFIVSTKKTDIDQVLRNVPNADTRKAALLAYWNRAGEANSKLLSDAVKTRNEIANLGNYLTWLGLQVSDRMAQTSKAVTAFLSDLTDKIVPKGKTNLDKLLSFKKESLPTATALDPWDIDYYAYQLKKRDYALDDEEIRQYFPADGVVRGIFEIYSKLLGVTFSEVTGADVWAEGVKLYRVDDAPDGRTIGYFYTDFIPRPGKYGHAAAFPLISPRVTADGSYAMPVSAIVANFTPPANGHPSLMAHDEVRTLFHEFGHIMHQTLTRAPYASLAGTNVATDFVEAPSQMLENWVYDPAVLALLSGHYQDPTKKLPDALLTRLIQARDFNQGYNYTRQCLLANFDVTLHTSDGSADPATVFNQLYQKFFGIPAPAGNHFAASFSHLMEGYDAGYYGYLWSEVRATDMFTVFAAHGLLDPTTGTLYRKTILEPGNMQDPNQLLHGFLGRDSNNAAFLSRLGL